MLVKVLIKFTCVLDYCYSCRLFILFYFSLCYIKLLHSGSICGRLLSLVSCIIYYTTCSQPVLALASVQHRIKKAKKIPKAKKRIQKPPFIPSHTTVYLPFQSILHSHFYSIYMYPSS